MDSLSRSFPFLSFLDVAKTPFLNNLPSMWVTALAIALIAYVFLSVIQRLIVRKIGDFAGSTENKADDLFVGIFQKTGRWFLAVISLYCGSLVLSFPQHGHRINQVLLVAVFLQFGIWTSLILNSVLQHWLNANSQDSSKNTAIIAFRFLGKLAIWSIILLLILDNLGVQVVSLMAGLGVGGIAVALAVQNILGDLLSSVSIVLDKPFEIGDFIIVGESMGSVESIGLKTTRIRSLSGEQLIISNSDLLGSRIRNFKRMYERRMVFPVGVTYGTKREHLTYIPVLLKELVEKQGNTRFERAHLKAYGDFAIQYECIYWITAPDMGLSMDIQQAINLELFDAFAEKGIEFAFPTQTLHIARS